VPLSVLMFIGTSPGELDSIPAEITEKLAAATLKLLRAVSDEPQATLIYDRVDALATRSEEVTRWPSSTVRGSVLKHSRRILIQHKTAGLLRASADLSEALSAQGTALHCFVKTMWQPPRVTRAISNVRIHGDVCTLRALPRARP